MDKEKQQILSVPKTFGGGNAYDYILSLIRFKDSCLESSEWMLEPFIINNLACATDAQLLVCFEKQFCYNSELNSIAHKHKESVLEMFSVPTLNEIVISLAEIEAFFEKIPLTDKVECDACIGSGDVNYEFYFDGSTYKKNCECPICNGEKLVKSNGKSFQFAPNSLIEINGTVFNETKIIKLYRIAKVLHEDYICISPKRESSIRQFRIGGVRLFINPSYCEDGEEILHKI